MRSLASEAAIISGVTPCCAQWVNDALVRAGSRQPRLRLAAWTHVGFGTGTSRRVGFEHHFNCFAVVQQHRMLQRGNKRLTQHDGGRLISTLPRRAHTLQHPDMARTPRRFRNAAGGMSSSSSLPPEREHVIAFSPSCGAAWRLWWAPPAAALSNGTYQRKLCLRCPVVEQHVHQQSVLLPAGNHQGRVAGLARISARPMRQRRPSHAMAGKHVTHLVCVVDRKPLSQQALHKADI